MRPHTGSIRIPPLPLPLIYVTFDRSPRSDLVTAHPLGFQPHVVIAVTELGRH